MSAIIKRELKAYFTSPLGYVVIIALTFFSGLFYANNLADYGVADISYVFNSMATIVFFIIPILTMRLLSEEKKQKTDQLLLTSPIKIHSIILGKFFAAMAFFSIFFVEMLLYNFVYMILGAKPDWMVFIGNLVGMLFVASSLTAIGILISALTESQVVAAICSFSVSFFLLIMDQIATSINNSVVTAIVNWISYLGRYSTFTQGIFDITNVVFFLSITTVFLFLSIRVLDRKRWA